MAGSLNKVLIIGNLTRDPELKYLPSGAAVCALAVATNSSRQDPQTGERKEYPEYHDVQVWNIGNRKLAELCAQYLAKGRKVYVEGELRTRSWDDQSTGQKRYRTEIRATDVQFLDGRQDGGGAGGGGWSGGSTGGDTAAPSAPAGGEIDPDDIPF